MSFQITTFEILTLFTCCFGSNIIIGTTGEEGLSLDPVTKLLIRQKRQGGGGIIPFRPLFVYRQQQREQQEKWKEIEARKKLKQQWVQYQQYEDSIKQNQQFYRPSTASISYSKPISQFSSYNYPYSYYDTYPASSGRYEYDKEPVYQKEPSSNYYQNYYDGYDYYSQF